MRAKACAFVGFSLSQACHASVSSIETSVLCRRTNQSAAARCVGSRSMSVENGMAWVVIAFNVYILAAVEQGAYHVFAYHAVGDAELSGDGGGVKSLDLVHDE